MSSVSSPHSPTAAQARETLSPGPPWGNGARRRMTFQTSIHNDHRPSFTSCAPPPRQLDLNPSYCACTSHGHSIGKRSGNSFSIFWFRLGIGLWQDHVLPAGRHWARGSSTFPGTPWSRWTDFWISRCTGSEPHNRLLSISWCRRASFQGTD